MSDRWRLGRFDILPASRLLLQDGQPLAIGGRAFDLLLALVQRAGEPVGKDELLTRAWPGVVVEENNLTVQVSALRKLLGADAVVTVPGRGYQLALVPQAFPGTASPAADERPSIAVLPFANGGTHADEPLCDGVTEDVITELSRFRFLTVLSRNTSFSFKGQATPPRRAARELGVRYVLEGSLRRAGEQVRVHAQLADARTGMQVWSERYDAALGDIFALQEELARAIVSSIAPQIDLSERSRAHRTGPGDLTAYELALRAWALLRTPESGDGSERRARASALAHEALALDPDSALAIRTIAWGAMTQLWMDPRPESVQAAEAAMALTDRVIAADNRDHHAYFFRGLLQMMLRRHETALLDLRRAHELNPNDAATLSYLGYAHASCGDAAQGLHLARRALDLSPRDPQRHLLLGQVASCAFIAGDDAQAASLALQATVDAPWFPGPWITLATSRAALGDLAGARAAVEHLRAIAPALLASRLRGEWIGSDRIWHDRALALLRRAAAP